MKQACLLFHDNDILESKLTAQNCDMYRCLDLVGSRQQVYQRKIEQPARRPIVYHMHLVMTSGETQIQVFADWSTSHAKRVALNKGKIQNIVSFSLSLNNFRDVKQGRASNSRNFGLRQGMQPRLALSPKCAASTVGVFNLVCTIQWRIQGRDPRGLCPPPLFWQKKRRNHRRKKSRLGEQNKTGPHPIAQGLDPPLQSFTS